MSETEEPLIRVPKGDPSDDFLLRLGRAYYLKWMFGHLRAMGAFTPEYIANGETVSRRALNALLDDCWEDVPRAEVMETEAVDDG